VIAEADSASTYNRIRSNLPEGVQGGRLMRIFSLWMLLATISAAVVGNAEPLRIGIPGLSAEFAPVWAANDRGLLKKFGFEPEGLPCKEVRSWHRQ
jgi:hypothetical protein